MADECMTEARWLTCDDPREMLGYLLRRNPEVGFRASERKLRLFACACARRAWHRLADPGSRRAVEVAERFADGLATEADLADAYDNAWKVYAWKVYSNTPSGGDYASIHDAYACAEASAAAAAKAVASAEQAAILREVVGNPFRPPPELRRSGGSVGGQGLEFLDWKSPWLTPTVLSLAQAAYEDRLPDGALDPVRLAILADALFDAGCDDAELLAHLQGRRRCVGCLKRLHEDCVCKGTGWLPAEKPPAVGPHVRGCFALDLILGKE